MGRKQRGERVIGVYPDRRRGTWYVLHVKADGARTSTTCATEAEARDVARDLEEEIAQATGRTIGDAVTAYLAHQRSKRLRPKTIAGNEWSLGVFFRDHEAALASVTPAWCAARYKALSAKYSVDYQRNTLSQSRSFLVWCVGQGWLRSDPTATVKGIGKRRKGKPQLRMTEARKWSAKAFELAPRWPGAVAALMALYLDMRTGEIVRAEVRDLDDDGRVLVVAEAKTEAGKRTLEIPPELRRHLIRLAKGRDGADRLLGGPHDPLWVTRWVKRICDLADVPVVCGQSMRGLHASIAVEHGATSHIIAKAMGHASSKTTMAHYASKDAQRRGRQRGALKLLRGGKK